MSINSQFPTNKVRANISQPAPPSSAPLLTAQDNLLAPDVSSAPPLVGCMITCWNPSCRKQYVKTDYCTICLSCGVPSEQNGYYCHKCGREISPADRFCPCGEEQPHFLQLCSLTAAWLQPELENRACDTVQKPPNRVFLIAHFSAWRSPRTMRIALSGSNRLAGSNGTKPLAPPCAPNPVRGINNSRPGHAPERLNLVRSRKRSQTSIKEWKYVLVCHMTPPSRRICPLGPYISNLIFWIV